MVAEEKTPDRGDSESEYEYREGASGVGCWGATSSWEQTRCAIDTGLTDVIASALTRRARTIPHHPSPLARSTYGTSSFDLPCDICGIDPSCCSSRLRAQRYE